MSATSEEKRLADLFSFWDQESLRKTIITANEMVARLGSAQKARESIAELAGGNVSLSCRAYFQPIERVLSAMERGFA
jgi:hypothetical protein